MTLYAAFDLHANSNHLGIIDRTGKRLLTKKPPNDPILILKTLKTFKRRLCGIVVESTFNWYWLTDLLIDAGYKVHLANLCAIQKYIGLKHSDYIHDAFWLAEQLRLNILPEGYIYPKEERPVRDFLRKRGHLVKIRTSPIISLQCIISRNFGFKVDAKDVKRLREDRISPLFDVNECLAMVGGTSKRPSIFSPIRYTALRRLWKVKPS